MRMMKRSESFLLVSNFILNKGITSADLDRDTLKLQLVNEITIKIRLFFLHEVMFILPRLSFFQKIKNVFTREEAAPSGKFGRVHML